MSRLVRIVLIVTVFCTALVLNRQMQVNGDNGNRANYHDSDHATDNLPPVPQSNADRPADVAVASDEKLPNSVTPNPVIVQSQEPKPPLESHPVRDRETEAEPDRDDLRAAIARDNAEADADGEPEDKYARRERFARNREASETLAWSYFLGTHDSVQDIAKARDMFTALASDGSAAAQFGLGVMYATGIGMNVSQPKALLYYTLAAWGEYPLAWMALGFRYFSGHSTDYNCDMAALYYHQIASHVVNGMDILGGQTVTRLRISDESDGSSNQMVDPEFVQYYQYLADKGESAAQLALGLLYLQGKHGVEQDIELAYDYLVQASENDNPQADAYLGRMYLKGTNVTPRDYEKAYEHFQRSASKDAPMGMVGLGLLYSLGFHVDKDQNRAKTLFTKAAEQGNAEGQLQLGNFFFRNQAPSSLAQMLSSVKNMRQAVKYWNMASQQGSALAYYNLGIAHVYGHGTPRMCRIGTEFLKIVSERGKHSQYFMSAHEDYRHGDVDSAMAKYALLAELGYETAHSNLAVLYERKIDLRFTMPLLFSAYPGASSSVQPENGTTAVVVKPSTVPSPKHSRILYINKNIPLMEDDAMRRAFYYWSQSAELGYAYARIRLGDYHFYGTGTPVNYVEAMTHYRTAAENHHNAQAMFNLGYMHEKGLGSSKDLHLAKRYYDMAIDTSSDAYLPCQLALSKLNVLFRWQQIKQSALYAAMPNLEVWLGRNWDLLLMTLSAILLAAAYFYVKLRRQRRVGAPVVLIIPEPLSGGAAGPSRAAAASTSSNQPATAAGTSVVQPLSRPMSADSIGSRTFVVSSNNSGSAGSGAAIRPPGAFSSSSPSTTTAPSAKHSFLGPVPTTMFRSTTTTATTTPIAGAASGLASSSSQTSAPLTVTGASFNSLRSPDDKKNSDDETEKRGKTDDTTTTLSSAVVRSADDDDARSSSVTRRRTSINSHQQNEPGDAESAGSGGSTDKAPIPPTAPAGWPSDID